jgi:hypothetical protein
VEIQKNYTEYETMNEKWCLYLTKILPKILAFPPSEIFDLSSWVSSVVRQKANLCFFALGPFYALVFSRLRTPGLGSRSQAQQREKTCVPYLWI